MRIIGVFLMAMTVLTFSGAVAATGAFSAPEAALTATTEIALNS